MNENLKNNLKRDKFIYLVKPNKPVHNQCLKNTAWAQHRQIYQYFFKRHKLVSIRNVNWQIIPQTHGSWDKQITLTKNTTMNFLEMNAFAFSFWQE